MENHLPRGIGAISSEEFLKSLERKSFWENSAIHPHVVDNPQSMEDVEKAKEGYIDFLYDHYPQLRGLSREKISSLTRRDLHYILHPEMETYSMDGVGVK
jgi:hypothetical protein